MSNIALLSDSLENVVSGLGTAKDKAAQGTFRTDLLSRATLDALYVGSWVAGAVVDCVADDMTRAWRTWEARPAQVEALEEAERTLKVRSAVARALKMSRLYGGGALYIGVAGDDPAEPLDLGRIGRGGLSYVVALTPWELTAPELDRDPLSPHFGQAAYYMLNGAVTGAVRVHPSRVVRLVGLELLDRDQATVLGGWGLSVLQRVVDAVRHAESSGQAVASLMQEAKTDIISVPDLTNNAADPTWVSAVLKRFALANVGKSINNALLLDAAETWTQRQVNFAGLPDVVRVFLDVCAGAAGIPVTRLMGKAPTGLSASADGEIRAYYDSLSSRQETDLRPALEKLDEALIRHALGRRPKSVGYRFASLWQLSDTEKAAIAKTKAEASSLYARNGLMDMTVLRAAVRSQLIEDGTYPGLADMQPPADPETLGEEAVVEGVEAGAQATVQERV